MFLKPFKIRTQTSIKGSDRKKLRQQLSTQYHGVSEDALKDLIPNKDDMTLMKITTHAGESVMVYCLHKNPMFFANELDRVVFPTVYALWKQPGLMENVFATWPAVLEKLIKGADLMLPGVIVTEPLTPNSLGSFPKGCGCAVKVVGNKSAVCVGMTALSAEDMFYSAMRGKGVISLHVYHDYLWAHGDKSEPPVVPDTELLEAMRGNKETRDDNGEECTDEGDMADSLQQLSVEEAADSEDAEVTAENTTDADAGAEGGQQAEKDEEEDEDDGRSTKERMDELLEICFLSAIKSKVKKSDLPLLTSKFYKEFMQPCCPRDKEIDVRRSSAKKLGKFLAGMKQKGYVSIKEQPKGVEKITEIHKDHPDIRSFQVPESVSEAVAEARAEVAAAAAAPPSGDQFQPPVITELYSLTAAAMPVFSAYGYSKGQALTVPAVRQVLTEYVKANQLDTQVRGAVTLDPVLSDLLQSKSEYLEHLAWDEVFSRCLSKLSPAYRLSVHGQQDTVKKGKLEAITLSIATRSGNKKVTLIHNLEVYGIELEEFAHSVQKGVACSTSISPLPGKNKGKEVLVQGNQINFIEQLLTEKYQLARKYIHGLDKAPKGKKKR